MSDDEEFDRPAFAVVGTYDPSSGPPTDGMDYLRSVRHEASQLGSVNVSNIDPRKFDSQQTRFVNPRRHDCIPPPPGLAAKTEWARQMATKFNNLREHIESLRASLDGKRPALPSYKDSQAWRKFCFDYEKYVASSSSSKANKKSAKSDKMAVDEENGQEAQSPESAQDSTKQEDKSKITLPPLRILLSLDEVRVTALLNYHINWIIGDNPDIATGETNLTPERLTWLFVLLALVDKPLDADTSANLRSLLKLLCKVRSTKTSITDPSLAQVYVIITIITEVFGQAETLA